MLDEEGRRQKAAKIVAVVRHALGVESLDGLRAVDVGCSAGFIADELALAGATTSGVDIDEPGLEKARARFGERVDFRLARGEDLPFDDDSVDVAVLNHIYEHVVDPEAVVADIHRVLRPGGLLYLGVGHRWQVIEPHHRLPFLSWLPRRAADRYLRLTGKGEHYYERYYTPAGLRRLFAAFDVWDYTLPVLTDPRGVRRRRQRARPGRPGCRRPCSGPRCRSCPTYVWAAFKGRCRARRSAAARAPPPPRLTRHPSQLSRPIPEPSRSDGIRSGAQLKVVVHSGPGARGEQVGRPRPGLGSRTSTVEECRDRSPRRARHADRRVVRTARPVPLGAVVGIFRRGGGDPTSRRDDARLVVRLAHARRPGDPPPRPRHPRRGEVTATAWGSGAGWMLERVPDLLGERDDPTGFVTHHPPVADAWRGLRRAGGCRARASSCRPSWPRSSSRRSPARRPSPGYRRLVRRFGEPAPGPGRGPRARRAARRRAAGPASRRGSGCAAGVDPARSRTVVRAVGHAGRLEECADLPADRGPGPAHRRCPASAAGPGPRWPSGPSACPTR